MLLPSPHSLRHNAAQLVSAASAALPENAGRRLDRWFRGYEEACRLRDADAAIVSPGKSGRTWLRVMISRYFAHKYGLSEGLLMDYDEFHRAKPAVPLLHFTHDNYLKDFLGHNRKLKTYSGKRVVLLVRDPRDTSVSSYFQWKHRMKPRKKVLNKYPKQDSGVFEFISSSPASVARLVDYLNLWAMDMPDFASLLLVRYEDMRHDPGKELRRILEFVGQQPSAGEIEDSVTYASLEQMRERERQAAADATVSSRLRPGDAGDLSTFKTRRGKVGGWRDYLTPEQAQAMDRLVADKLSPVYGYNPPAAIAAAADGGLVSPA